jgi:hypothetical protein
VLDSSGRSNSGPEDISFFLSKMFVVHQFWCEAIFNEFRKCLSCVNFNAWQRCLWCAQ